MPVNFSIFLKRENFIKSICVRGKEALQRKKITKKKISEKIKKIKSSSSSSSSSLRNKPRYLSSEYWSNNRSHWSKYSVCSRTCMSTKSFGSCLPNIGRGSVKRGISGRILVANKTYALNQTAHKWGNKRMAGKISICI